MSDRIHKHLPLKVLYTGAVKDLSGYASAARDYIRSLDTVGIDVSVDARTFEIQNQRLVEEVVERNLWSMMSKPRDAHLQIVHLTPDNYKSYAHNQKYKVGYFAWETSRLPSGWVNSINEICREVWVPCEYIKQVSITSGVSCPVHVVPHAVPILSDDWTPSCSIASLPDDKFKFYSIAQWCHDDQTRVLTREGFKFFNEVTILDELATVNQDTGELEYQSPVELVKFPYNGELYKLNSKQFDFAITPEHRLLTRHFNEDKWSLTKAEDLVRKDGRKFNSSYRTLKHVSWVGDNPEFFYPPQVQYGNTNMNVSVEKIPVEKFLRFFGWYLSEGCSQITKRGYRVEITQITNQDFIEEIIQSIRDIGFRPIKASHGKIIFYSKQMCLYLKQFGLAKEKFVPGWIKQLSPYLLSIFLDSLFKGDGSFWSDGRWMKYITGSKQLAEDVLECLIKVGKSGAISTYHGQSPHYPERKTFGYTVSVNHSHLEPQLSNTPLIREHYDGTVYCASVPNGTLVTERNGKILISGNSERKNLLGLLRAYYQEFDKSDPVVFILKTYRVGNDRSERDFIRREISKLKRETRGVGCPPVIIIEEFLSACEIQSIHYYGDCYVSMARSEGFALPAFESAAMGNPVIVPNYSAFPEYFTNKTSYLVDVPSEVPIKDMKHISLLYTGDMVWGDPSIEDCQKQLRSVFQNQEQAKQKGLAARQWVKDNLSYQAIGRLMKGHIERINREILNG